MMIGSAEKDIQAVQAGAPEDLPEVINDLEDIGEEISIEQKEEHLNKIRKWSKIFYTHVSIQQFPSNRRNFRKMV